MCRAAVRGKYEVKGPGAVTEFPLSAIHGFKGLRADDVVDSKDPQQVAIGNSLILQKWDGGHLGALVPSSDPDPWPTSAEEWQEVLQKSSGSGQRLLVRLFLL